PGAEDGRADASSISHPGEGLQPPNGKSWSAGRLESSGPSAWHCPPSGELARSNQSAPSRRDRAGAPPLSWLTAVSRPLEAPRKRRTPRTTIPRFAGAPGTFVPVLPGAAARRGSVLSTPGAAASL